MSGHLDQPGEYSTPGLRPTVPGADWYIEGRRYREVSRTPTPNGYTIEVVPCGLPWSDEDGPCPTGSTA